MLELAVFFGVIGWACLQFRGWRSARWSRRWHEWYVPIVRKLVADARAIVVLVGARKRYDVDAELRDLLGGA